MFDELHLFSTGNILSQDDLNAIMKTLMGLDGSPLEVTSDDVFFSFGNSLTGFFSYDADKNLSTIEFEKTETTINRTFYSSDGKTFSNEDIVHLGTTEKPIVKIGGNIVSPSTFTTTTDGKVVFNTTQTGVSQITVDGWLVAYKRRITFQRDVYSCLIGITVENI